MKYIFPSSTLLLIMVFSFSMGAMAQEKTAVHLLQKDLTDIPGREGVMLTVEYPAGSSSPKHRHNAYTFVYVLEGSVIMQVEGQEKVTLEKGQTFYEKPDDIHTVSMNASNTEPAKILVFFVKKKGEPMSVPVE